MKRFAKRSLLGLALTGLLVAGATQTVVAGHHPQGLKTVLKQLDLDTTQKQDLRQIMRERKDNVSVIREDLKDLKAQMQTLIQSDQWQADQVETLLQNRSDLMQQVALEKAKGRHAMWQLLTEAQQTQFDELRSERTGKRKDKRMARMLAKLELSDQQQTQVDAILDGLKAEKEAYKAQHQTLKQAQRDLIRAEQFDEQAWHELYQQYATGMLDVAIKTSYGRHQIWNLLTPAQQDKVEHMQLHKREKRRQRMQDHSII